ncbi:MAG: DUF4350 domain-containing protein [Halolamina sp.]|uniref:DUF4350 domain-containing protein n=1 Tax=Halolamina sp. TaxID=1940283 RepID=UPI002FC3D073
MAADWLPEGWSTPQLLLVALVLTVALTGVVAASTSQSALGAYNPAWDGASDLRDLVSDEGAESLVALNTTSYTTTEPNGTIAVILSPDEAYSPSERTRVTSFVEQGGTLVVAEDYGPHTRPLLGALGVQTRIDGAPLRDEQAYYRSPAFPLATNVSESPETAGVDQLTLNHGTSLRTNRSINGTTVLASSSEFAYLDRNRTESLDDSEELTSRPVVVRETVGEGAVYVVADPSLFINAMLERPGNAQFARNLFGAHERVLLDYSHLTGTPPLMRAVLILQGTPFWQVLLAVLGLSAIVWNGRLREQLVTLRDWATAPEEQAGGLALSEADPDAFLASLSRQHPDWDEQRLRRVMRGVIRNAEGTGSDE